MEVNSKKSFQRNNCFYKIEHKQRLVTKGIKINNKYIIIVDIVINTINLMIL